MEKPIVTNEWTKFILRCVRVDMVHGHERLKRHSILVIVCGQKVYSGIVNNQIDTYSRVCIDLVVNNSGIDLLTTKSIHTLECVFLRLLQ